jgi:hypothetical protein
MVVSGSTKDIGLLENSSDHVLDNAVIAWMLYREVHQKAVKREQFVKIAHPAHGRIIELTRCISEGVVPEAAGDGSGSVHRPLMRHFLLALRAIGRFTHIHSGHPPAFRNRRL